MSAEKTITVGYFNPNDYPMQVVVSEVNLTLNLGPKQYVVDRAGRLVNDPILDKYVGKGRLSRASNPKQKADVIRLQPVNSVAPAGAPPNQHQHPVFQAQGFARNQQGQMQPVLATPTSPAPNVQPPVSYNPVQGMTVEQAKRLRLIKPTRQVPEDAGATETTGAPLAGEQIPTIQYATDTSKPVQARPVAPVTQAQPATPTQAAMIESLNQSVQVDPEAADAAEQAVKAARQNPQAFAAAEQPTAPPPPPMINPAAARLAKVTGARPSAPPIPTNPQPTEMTPTQVVEQPLPEPVLSDDSTEVVVDEELPQPKLRVPPPPTEEEEEEQVPAPAKPKVAEGTVQCPECNVKPMSKGYLKRHVKAHHKDKAPALIAQLGL